MVWLVTVSRDAVSGMLTEVGVSLSPDSAHTHDTPPPTSQLVDKLFPKLKQDQIKQQQQQQQVLHKLTFNVMYLFLIFLIFIYLHVFMYSFMK